AAVTNGLAFIKSTQADNGGFLSWGATNADTNSYGILAIKAAGQYPTSANWTENGNTPIDDLVNFRQDNGQFNWQDGDPGGFPCQTTANAIQALLGKPHPINLTWWDCPLDHEALISPYPVNGRSSLTANIALSEVTCDAAWFQVYWLDEATGQWLWYDSMIGSGNLTQLEPRDFYYVVVSGPTSLRILKRVRS
ncbi:MAG: hypothetical protein SU899_03445, partial [Chloroflexota bacterium]|nr:hypothetical protein [Chloroflexota bacterium]